MTKRTNRKREGSGERRMRGALWVVIALAGLGTASDLAQTTSLVVDGHTHQGLTSVEGSIDSTGLDGLQSMGIHVLVQTLPVDRSRTGDVFDRLSREVDEVRVMARERGQLYLLEDLESASRSSAESRTGILFGMEWFQPTFQGDASLSFRLRELGIRIFGLPDEDPDGLFLSGERANELSPFGRLVVRSLNEAGVLIDLTHLNHDRMLAVIAASSAPTVVTHGNVRSVADRTFNLPGRVLRALAESGGHVWISFNRNGLLEVGEDDSQGRSRLLDNIEALVGHLGKDHVGLGTDLQADGKYVPAPLNQPGTIARLRSGLLERGFTEAEVDGILGRNVLRALSTVDRDVDRPHRWPALSGPYMGQTPPGMIAEIFAPGIISTEGSEINSVFSPDGKEFYFTTWEEETGTRILVTRQVDGLWSPLQRASFSTDPSDVDPAISLDGQRLVFSSRRPRPGESQGRVDGFDMWSAEREGSEWGEARFLGSILNSGTSQVYPSFTQDGTLYFQAVRDGGYGKADIYRSHWRHGAYQEPENVGPAINSENYEGDVFVAPDESYLIVSASGREDGLGEADLYIGFRRPDGEWSPLRNMGPAVNSEKREFCPMLSPDGKVLFFTSKRNGEGDIFWVDSRIIEALRAENGDFSSRSGPYLGQDPPGSSAVEFAPELSSIGDVCTGFMNGAELFVFKILSPALDWKFEPVYYSQLTNGRWTDPAVAPLGDLYPYNYTVGPDGKTLFFTSVRDPKDPSLLLRKPDLWKVERTNDGWSLPECLGPPVNTDEFSENYPSVMRDGTLYFMSWRDDGLGRDDIYRSRRVGDRYLPPENVGAPVNTELSEIDPFVAADGSYLLYCSESPDGLGKWDLYVSFRNEEGSWMRPQNLGGQVNSNGADLRPSVTPDGKYLFFTSDRSGEGKVYWVSTEVIESLRRSGVSD